MLHECATMENMGEYVACNMLHMLHTHATFAKKNKSARNIGENEYKYIKTMPNSHIKF